MSRSSYRVEYSGAVYHVTQRGNNKEKIFHSDKDKLLLRKKIWGLKKAFDFVLFGYVLMDNHYHILLQTREEPLSKIMHRLNNFYSHYFNKKYQRSGHVFGGRYKASLIQGERYLLAALRYVHWNPIKAGLSRNPAEYRWSSDSSYRKNEPGFVNIDFVLDLLDTNRSIAIKKYNQMMQMEDPTDVDYEEKDTGSVNLTVTPVKPPGVIANNNCFRQELDHILKRTGVSPADYELIKEGSRKRHLVPFKIAYALEALKQQYSLKEIGENIGISDAAIHKLINK
jgi:putative transposase